MSAVSKSASTGTVLAVICGTELRRQVADFIAAEGYACLTTPTLQAALETLSRPEAEVDLVMAEVRLHEAQSTAASITAVRPEANVLFVCSAPSAEAKRPVTDRRVTFIEKPFAWGELRQVLSRCDGLAPAA